MTDLDDRLDEFWDLGYRVAHRIVGRRDAASDIAQEALVRLARSWGWVHIHARGFTAVVAAERAIGTGESDLASALSGLPRPERDVVVLRHLAEFSAEETTWTLGCSPETMGQRSVRGLAALGSLGVVGARVAGGGGWGDAPPASSSESA